MEKISVKDAQRVKSFVSQIFVSLGIAMLGASFAISSTTTNFWNLTLFGIAMLTLGSFINFTKPRAITKKQIRVFELRSNLSFNVALVTLMVILIVAPLNIFSESVKIYALATILIIFFFFKLSKVYFKDI